MKTLFVAITALLSLVAVRPAAAEIGTIDAVPAATLLLPYFEVDLQNPDGVTTLFSVNNASASAAVAHVTLWTDEAVPTFAFGVYLTGYDVQTINLRDVLNGVLPVTADDGSDPQDTGSESDGISNQGDLSQDINFPGDPSPCGSPTGPIPAEIVQHLRAAHTGQASAVQGGLCAGSARGDGIARGYVTVDSVTQCNLLFPNQTGYFSNGIADTRNLLWGDYFFVNSSQNFAQGDTLVHVESCIPGNGFNGPVGNGAGHCPFAPGDYTFYGAYAPVAGQDQREPLPTTWAARFVNGGAFNGGTDLIVWRDPKAQPALRACDQPRAPLAQRQVVAFDEQENPVELCAGGQTCMPLAAQRVPTASAPTPFGWLFVDLNHALPTADPFPGVAQSWVVPLISAEGRYSVGMQGIALDNATAPLGQQPLPVPTPVVAP